MSAYDDEDDVITEADELADFDEGFSIEDNPNDPEVDLEESDLADFAFADDEEDLGDDEGDF